MTECRDGEQSEWCERNNNENRTIIKIHIPFAMNLIYTPEMHENESAIKKCYL